MKKNLIALSLLLFAGSSLVKAQENKITYKFGGFIEFKSYFDDYRSRVSRYDHIYFYPLAPKLNTSGTDMNSTGSLNFSVATSRLSFTVSGMRLLNANITSYIEADFTGSSESYIGMLNLRHAYLNMEWEKSSLLFGQTDHLTSVKEVVGQTIGFGAGYPFNPLNRNMQIRFTQKLAKGVDLILAAHMFSGHNSLGPAKAQAQAGLPNLQAPSNPSSSASQTPKPDAVPESENPNPDNGSMKGGREDELEKNIEKLEKNFEPIAQSEDQEDGPEKKEDAEGMKNDAAVRASNGEEAAGDKERAVPEEIKGIKDRAAVTPKRDFAEANFDLVCTFTKLILLCISISNPAIACWTLHF